MHSGRQENVRSPLVRSIVSNSAGQSALIHSSAFLLSAFGSGSNNSDKDVMGFLVQWSCLAWLDDLQ